MGRRECGRRMQSLVGIITLLTVVATGLIITRIATVALTYTGLSRDLARFQARSAFTGCGFTTTESERLVEHPVRRRIVMLLMLLGNGVVVMAISSIIPILLEVGAESRTLGSLAVQAGGLAGGLAILWMLAASKWVDRHLSRIIAWALETFTDMRVEDYHSLLHLEEGYAVTEMKVEEGDWVSGKALIQLRLSHEGIQILGIRREDGEFIGTPTGHTVIRPGDTLLVYAEAQAVPELEQRDAGPEGDAAHERRVQHQRNALAAQERADRTEADEEGTPLPAYHELLNLSEGYSITEMKVGEGHWLAGKALSEVRLGDEGMQVLGIHRHKGEFVAAPVGTTRIHAGDMVLVYGRSEDTAQLERRSAGPEGDAAHERRATDHETP